MKKNLLKIAIASLAATFIIGCGGSGGGDDETIVTPDNTPVVVDVRACTFTVPNTGTLSADGIYTPAISAVDGNGARLTDVLIVSDPTFEADIETAGTYNLTITSPSCDNNGDTALVIAEYKAPTVEPTPPAPAGDFKDENILPF